jgi:hypothetical protein
MKGSGSNGKGAPFPHLGAEGHYPCFRIALYKKQKVKIIVRSYVYTYTGNRAQE